MSDSILGIGVDQGIANCGYSIVELTGSDEIRILASGTIKTKSSEPLQKRISRIYQTLSQLSIEHNVHILGCERLFFSPKQKSETNKSGRNKSASIVYTNMATGVLYLISAENDILIKDFVPGTVKKYVAGHGKATKEEVKESVTRIVPMEIKTEHEADAIAIGITAVKYMRKIQSEGEPVVPKKRKRKKKGVMQLEQ